MVMAHSSSCNQSSQDAATESPDDRRPSDIVRVAIVSDRRRLRRWEVACVDAIAELKGCVIVGAGRLGAGALVAGDAGAHTAAHASTPAAAACWRERLLGQVDAAWIAGLRPSLVLQFGDGAVMGTPGTSIPHGVWSFARRGPNGKLGPLRLVIASLTEETVELVLRRTDWQGHSEEIVASGRIPASPISPRGTVTAVHSCAALMLRKAIAELGTYGHAVGMPAVAGVGASHRRRIGLDKLIVPVMRLGKWIVEKGFYDFRWRIGIVRPLPSLRDDNALVVKWLDCPTDGFLADPCAVAGIDDWVLAEHFEYKRGKGRLCALKLEDDKSRVSTMRPVLELEKHLSFPQVYESNGQMVLVPETRSYGCQLAFELDASLRVRDVRGRVLEGLQGVDPALFRADGLWWAFTSPGGRNGNHLLNLFYARDIWGPYQLHPLNPVVMDPHGGRSAGPVIEREGQLLRFGQVYGSRYGEGIDVFEITELSTTRYSEKRVGRLRLPNSSGGPIGMHGITFFPWAAVVDGCELVFSWRAGLRRLRARFAEG